MSARTLTRLRGDGGAVIVEAALVLPILFAFMFGLVEYSTTEFQQSQATSAARDGARAGIVLDYTTADVSGSATNTAIQTAATSKLGNQQNVTVQVWCVLADGTTTVACNSSQLRPGDGFLRVRVSWPYRSVTGTKLLVPSTISGTSQMSLVGATVTVSTTTTTSTSTTSTSTTSTSTTSTTSTSTTSTTQPATTTTTAPTTCVLTTTPTTTNGVSVGSNKKLSADLMFSNVVTNGATGCGVLQLTVWKSASGMTGTPTTNAMVAGTGNSWTYTFQGAPQGTNGWNSGTVTYQITTAGGTALMSPAGTFTLG